jgi:hypothetical protein
VSVLARSLYPQSLIVNEQLCLGARRFARSFQNVVEINEDPAMKRMSASNVLIVGLDGLGVEIGERDPPTLTYAEADTFYSEEHRPRRCQVFDHLRPPTSDD